MNTTQIIRPAKTVAGSLRLPGDKSVSHRYALLAAIAEGSSRLENFSTGADCASTLACLRALGARIDETHAPGQALGVEIHGMGPALSAPKDDLDCGNSGSTMRMLAGILAGQTFAASLTGDESLSRRPMERVITPLGLMGAHISSSGGRPPLRLAGVDGPLRAIEYRMPVASAQVKSAVLFAGLFAGGETAVEESIRTRDHGELALRAFGAELTRVKNRVAIRGGQKLNAIRARIPGDISSAAFFLCAAAIFPESNLVLQEVCLNPTRAAILDVLVEVGASVRVVDVAEHHGELVGTVTLQHRGLNGAVISGGRSAALIDELPVLAAIAPFTEQGIEIRDARELRIKESDRISTVAANLRAMGARVEERDDGLRIPGAQKLHGAEINSAGDHRIAMAFSVAALRAEGESLIQSADCARISFPEFFAALEEIAVR
jgi:3-phosphoshikimate 1-carboxyvinyltransferase